jgi:hypothetical protein
MGGECGTNGGRILVGKHEGTRVLVRPRSRWEENIKIILQNVEWGGELVWFGWGQGRILCM